jgi:hypothetical protein
MNIKNSISRFDRLMAAITFAEAGDRETALEVLYTEPKQKKNKWIGSKVKNRIKNRLKKRKDAQPDIRL